MQPPQIQQQSSQPKLQSPFYSKLRTDGGIFSNLIYVLDKIEEETSLSLLTSLLTTIFEQEVKYTVKELSKQQKLLCRTEFEQLFVQNTIIFKENFKLIINYLIEYIWKEKVGIKQIEQLSQAYIKENFKGNCEEIRELDEEQKYSANQHSFNNSFRFTHLQLNSLNSLNTQIQQQINNDQRQTNNSIINKVKVDIEQNQQSTIPTAKIHNQQGIEFKGSQPSIDQICEPEKIKEQQKDQFQMMKEQLAIKSDLKEQQNLGMAFKKKDSKQIFDSPIKLKKVPQIKKDSFKQSKINQEEIHKKYQSRLQKSLSCDIWKTHEQSKSYGRIKDINANQIIKSNQNLQSLLSQASYVNQLIVKIKKKNQFKDSRKKQT